MNLVPASPKNLAVVGIGALLPFRPVVRRGIAGGPIQKLTGILM